MQCPYVHVLANLFKGKEVKIKEFNGTVTLLQSQFRPGRRCFLDKMDAERSFYKPEGRGRRWNKEDNPLVYQKSMTEGEMGKRK